MHIEHDVDLTRFGSMATPSCTREFVRAHDEPTLQAAIAYATRARMPWFVLGGGSNLLLPSEFDGLVIRLCMRGVRTLRERPHHVELEIAAGENWHDLVRRSLAAGLTGLESLALIPGTVGAAPIQNIGAYGAELAEVLASARVVVAESGDVLTLDHSQCAFAYRDSVFKRAVDAMLVTRVCLRLPRVPRMRARYPDVEHELLRLGIAGPNPIQIAEAVVRVRRRKLPDPRRFGNVGSFFKNPVLDAAAAERLFAAAPALRALARPESIDGVVRTKVPAAALIERTGWKGRVDGRVEAWRRQPLVLVNLGGARREDVLSTAARITHDVGAQFGVQLQVEPRLDFPRAP